MAADCYVRIPISMECMVWSDGRMEPRCVLYRGHSYPIDGIIGIRARIPPSIACSDPLEYTVRIGAHEKRLYYDRRAGTWFSVRRFPAGTTVGTPSSPSHPEG